MMTPLENNFHNAQVAALSEELDKLDEPENLPRCLRQLTEQDDEDSLLGLLTQQGQDWEFERPTYITELVPDELDGSPRKVTTVIWDDPSSVAAYFTTSGDSPVIETVAAQQDKLCRLTNEVQAPDTKFYSASGAREFKQQHRNFIRIMLGLEMLEQKGMREDTLNRNWRNFWKKFFAVKKKHGDARSWLLNKHVNSIIAFFARWSQPKAVEMARKNASQRREARQNYEEREEEKRAQSRQVLDTEHFSGVGTQMKMF